MIQRAILMATAITIGAAALPLSADEGMWLFTNPPKKQLKEKYGFEANDAWYDHLRQSAVRFNSGGSGSFVSPDGLVMTNHHVGADALAKMSGEGNDLIKDGFYATTHDKEIKCVDLELNVLMSIEDVTAKVKAAVPDGTPAADAEKARRAVMNAIEKESTDKTGLRSDVITLYHGGVYHLYRYKKYTDIRLVFAPEQDIAFFGGDPDNFEFPRFDLDVCFFRVYENGKPVKPEHYLKWSVGGVKEGDLAFVAGHPGHTDRLNTVAHLETLRDFVFPKMLTRLRRMEVLLANFGERSEENERRAKDELFSIKNSRKARLGGLAGLQDPAVMKKCKDEEAALKKAVLADPKLKASCGGAWDQVEASMKVWKEIYPEYAALEAATAFQCRSFGIARSIVRYAEETAKPNADRLREYRDSNLDSFKQQLYSTAPIYKDLETIKLADSLSFYAETFGYDDPTVQRVLRGKSPQARAEELIAATKVDDAEYRKKLSAGGKKAIEDSKDPMIELARLVDPLARKVRTRYEQDVEEPQRQAYGKIAEARFAVFGTNVYPDATFTLRLAYGDVKGYKEGGRQIPAITTFKGLYERSAEHKNRVPYNLPQRWLDKKSTLDMNTPMNFVFTADIIGGNSGSPVVNRNNEVVGLIFDGNIQSLVWDFVYDSAQGRATAVHSEALIEALRRVYGAGALADELTGKKSDSEANAEQAWPAGSPRRNLGSRRERG